jgi:hypothetical protein
LLLSRFPPSDTNRAIDKGARRTYHRPWVASGAWLRQRKEGVGAIGRIDPELDPLLAQNGKSSVREIIGTVTLK